MKKRTEITIETHRRVRIRGEAFATGWCPDCAEQVEFLGPEQLAQLLDLSLREVYRRFEAGKFHGQEAPGSHLLICVKSAQQTKGDV